MVDWRLRKLKRGQCGGDAPIYMMPPRYVITDDEKTEEYVEYHKAHLPDISHFPTHEPGDTHFWKMGKNRAGGKRRLLKGGKARGRPHPVLKGSFSLEMLYIQF